jgi:glycolate oxidase FAD binding subunit
VSLDFWKLESKVKNKQMKAMSSDKPLRETAPGFTSIVGKDAVCLWENVEQNHQQLIQKAISDQATTHPGYIVYPQTQAELAEVIAESYRSKCRILVCGSGSKLNWGGLATEIDVVVSTKNINRIIEHADSDLTITVEAGMKFAELEAILAQTNQFIALDPTAPTVASIGGIIATSDTNSLRQRYGSVRDQLLGITFIRADGQLAKAGGRVVKNVAGYDLMKLFTGSYGTLGIITQVTFRLYPVQQTSATTALVGKAEALAEATSILRGSALTPTQADLLSTHMVTSLGLGEGVGLIARFQSIAASVQEQSNRLLEVGQKLGLTGTIYSGVDETDLWQRLLQPMYSSSNCEAIICKIGILPTAAVEILTQAEIGFVHMSSGLGMLKFANEQCIEEVRNLCQEYHGFLTILAAPAAIKQKLDVWGYRGNGLELMRGIKKQFDPENILNPGRFVGGI